MGPVSFDFLMLIFFSVYFFFKSSFRVNSVFAIGGDTSPVGVQHYECHLLNV